MAHPQWWSVSRADIDCGRRAQEIEQYVACDLEDLEVAWVGAVRGASGGELAWVVVDVLLDVSV